MEYIISTQYKYDVLRRIEDYINRNVVFTLDDEIVYIEKCTFLNQIGFTTKEGRKISSKDEIRIIQNVKVKLDKIEGVEFNYIPEDEVLTKKYRDFETGEYLVVVYDIRSMEVENELFVCHRAMTSMGPCFGYDVEDRKKILAYIKLRDL